MKKVITSFALVISLAMPQSAFSFFGNPADTVALLQILANNIKQLIEMRNMIRTAKHELQMVKDLNSGIDYALGVVESRFPNQALSLYNDWKYVGDSEDKLQAIYGAVVNSKNKVAQEHMDRSVIDAVIQNNETLRQAGQVDKIGDRISRQSEGASPKGAARLAAQGIGVGLHVQNQSLRIQASQLKLQAQKVAYENKIEKEETKIFLDSAKQLKSAMKGQKNTFRTPRF